MDDEEVPVLGQEERVGVEQLYCFISPDRVCSPECMAFLTFPRESKSSELSGVQNHCVFIQNADRLGRNSVILTSTLVERSQRQKIAQQDAQREANTPKPGAAIGPFAQPTSPFPTGNKS